jgi:uncharacterized protein (DUF305 family)
VKRSAVALIALVASIVLTACGNDTTPATGAEPAAGGGDHNAADVTFAQEMIPHHRQAIEMAEMAASRASTPEVKALAARITAAQGPEIRTMTGWLTSWDEDVPSSGGHETGAGGMMGDEKMATLTGATGAVFDRMFLTMMTEHHEGAIETARTEQTEGRFGPAKDLAGKIVKDQQAEIAEMARLLASR